MSWLRPRQDVPLAKDVTGRALPWVLAVLAFLAVLVLSGAFSVQQLLSRWQQGLQGAVSAQILPIGDEVDRGARPPPILFWSFCALPLSLLRPNW
jgi:hypothetical protein